MITLPKEAQDVATVAAAVRERVEAFLEEQGQTLLRLIARNSPIAESYEKGVFEDEAAFGRLKRDCTDEQWAAWSGDNPAHILTLGRLIRCDTCALHRTLATCRADRDGEVTCPECVKVYGHRPLPETDDCVDCGQPSADWEHPCGVHFSHTDCALSGALHQCEGTVEP